MSYTILPYTHTQAKRLGVIVRPSSTKGKKIDVYIGKDKVATIGALGMNDYPTYIKKMGKEYADKRRALYKQRHEKDRKVKGSNGYYADQLLW
jgi:hypothetical protein